MARYALNVVDLIGIGSAVADYPVPHELGGFKPALIACMHAIDKLGPDAETFEERAGEQRTTLWAVAELLIGSQPRSTRQVFCTFRELYNRLRRLRSGSQEPEDAYEIVSLAYALGVSERFVEAAA